MKKLFIFAVVLLIVGLGIYFFTSQPTKERSLKINSFEECLLAGNLILESYPRQCVTADGKNFIEEIGNELEKIDLIIVNNPRPNQKISSPVEISGQARGFWFFEADFPVLLLDDSGQIISQTIATAQSPWMTEEFVFFKSILEFPSDLSGKAKIVFKKDNPSGLPEHDDQLIVPVYLEPTESIKIQVFFNNDHLNPDFDCDKVFSVERTIPKTQAVARAALEELLKGPTEQEKREGFSTSINPGVKIQKIAIENKIAKADFNEQLEFQIGGSCWVTAIRSQINETLKQFPTVDEVVISVDERKEDVLQP